MLCANALMSGRALPTFLELLGPRDGRAASVLTMILGAALVVTTLIGAETALGFVFDPRYRDFPFAALTMAVVPFSLLMLLNRPQDGVRPIAETVFAACWRARCFTSYPARAPTTGNRCGPARVFPARALRCGGRGPRKSQNKQADRDTRQADIVEHDAEPGAISPPSAARSTAGSREASR
jgi:hypothetical protein